MKCDGCQQVLEDYFDGELAGRAAGEVRAHLAGCTACASALAGLRQAHEIYARYDRGVEVRPELWAGIQARLKAERAAAPATPKWRAWLAPLFAAPHISPAFAAAMVVVAIGVTVAVMSYLNSRDTVTNVNPQIAVRQPTDPGDGNKNGAASVARTSNENANPDLSASPDSRKGSVDDSSQPKELKPAPQKRLYASKSPSPPDPMKLVREAEQKYLAAIAIMTKDVNRQRSQIDPAVLARFDAALLDIDRTIQETRQVVRRNPEDPVALQYLLAAYAKKVDTLRAMALD